MEAWLSAALDYIPRWIEYQMRLTGQPGCSFAIAHKGRVVLERAFGSADLAGGKALTSRHRFGWLRIPRHLPPLACSSCASRVCCSWISRWGNS